MNFTVKEKYNEHLNFKLDTHYRPISNVRTANTRDISLKFTRYLPTKVTHELFLKRIRNR